MSFLEKVFEENQISVCVRDKGQKVLYQNACCVKNCSVNFGDVCDKDCMERYFSFKDAPERNLGTQYYPNQNIGEQYYDLVFMETNEHCTTLLFPLRNKHREDLKYFERFDLTKRELEIVQHIVRGLNNSEISEELGISKSTLKTHLNHIYKKVPNELIFSGRKVSE